MPAPTWPPRPCNARVPSPPLSWWRPSPPAGRRGAGAHADPLRDHLAQVLGTYAVILIANDLVKMIWGRRRSCSTCRRRCPTGATVAGPALSRLPPHDHRLRRGRRAGPVLVRDAHARRVLVRAGASNRQMATLMGVRVPLLFLGVFALGAMLAAVAGAARPDHLGAGGHGRGDPDPGAGLYRHRRHRLDPGRLCRRLLVGMVDTAGRAFLPMLLRQVFSPAVSSVGPTLAAIAIYVLMAAVLVFRPSGLFPARGKARCANRLPGPWSCWPCWRCFPWSRRARPGFYISFVRRVLIYALAATSLNLILGYGGMVALGHAAFFGAGAYAVGILAMSGVTSALVSWPVAVALAAVLACVTGAISLRTRGVYFIMITLAFAQMLFYIFISLRQYGGEDGLNLPGPSTLPGCRWATTCRSTTWCWRCSRSCPGCSDGWWPPASAPRCRHTRERVAHGVSGLSGLRIKLAAFTLSGAAADWPGAAGQPQPVHLAQPDALDPVGQPADHGAGGRHRPAPWRRGRRGGDADAGRGSALVDGILAPAAGRAAAGRGVRRARLVACWGHGSPAARRRGRAGGSR